MKRLAECALAALLGVVVAAGELSGSSSPSRREEPFPPKGAYTNSVHRYFPDLDARLNAVRYGRWRALEIAWISGIDNRLDRQFSSYLLALVADPPRYAPEADRVAPRFAREAPPVFRALRWGQTFEQQVIDVLASPDADSHLTSERLQRVFELYRREVWAPTEPPDERSPAELFAAAPVSARILAAGTRLFALSAEDLAASDFGQQRWRVRKTVQEFDASYAAPEDAAAAQSAYRTVAPTIGARYPRIGETLDRLARFRIEVFAALLGGDDSLDARRARAARLAEVARRWGVPAEEIGAR
jgi:hypothetical protein